MASSSSGPRQNNSRYFSQGLVARRAPLVASSPFSPVCSELYKRCFSTEGTDQETLNKMKEIEKLNQQEEIKGFLHHSFLGKFLSIFMGPLIRCLRIVELCSNDPQYKHVAEGIKLIGKAFKYVICACAVYLGSMATEAIDEFRKDMNAAGSDRATIFSEIISGNQLVVDQMLEVKALLNGMIQQTEKDEPTERIIRQLENEIIILKAHMGAPKLQVLENVRAFEKLMSDLEKEVKKHKQEYETYVQQIEHNLKSKEKLIADLEREVTKLKEDNESYTQKVSRELKDKESQISELKAKLGKA